MFIKTEHGFWRQVDPQPFVYTEDYKQKQSTNSEMSYLRLGWLTSFFTFEQMRQMSIVDVGCGNSCFAQCAENVFGKVAKYDVVGESITKEQLYDTDWDIVVLSDVLEHFEDINDLFKMRWKYCFISFPETPVVNNWEQLVTWRHFKPNEHLWCLNRNGMSEWFIEAGCDVVAISHFEDFIRRRWDPRYPNITTMLVERAK